DAVFSSTRHRGHDAAATTWDDMGVRELAGRPLRVVGTGAWAAEESARATFFRERVMDARGRRGQWRDEARPPTRVTRSCRRPWPPILQPSASLRWDISFPACVRSRWPARRMLRSTNRPTRTWP